MPSAAPAPPISRTHGDAARRYSACAPRLPPALSGACAEPAFPWRGLRQVGASACPAPSSPTAAGFLWAFGHLVFAVEDPHSLGAPFARLRQIQLGFMPVDCRFAKSGAPVPRAGPRHFLHIGPRSRPFARSLVRFRYPAHFLLKCSP